MKVFHLIKLSGIGGVQNQFETFLKYVESRHPEVSSHVLSIGGIDEHFVYGKKNCTIGMASVFWQLLRNRKKIIHSYNNLTSNKFYKIFKFIRPKSLIFHERGNCWNYQDKIEVVQKNADLAKVVLVNSEATKSMLVKRYMLDATKIKVIHNGVIGDFDYDSCSRHIDKDKGHVTIGYIGRLETNKGVQSLIEAIDILKNNYADKVKLEIWGDGALKNILLDYAKGKGSIQFMGRALDPYMAISNFDLMVIPSIREPFGNVAVEAGILNVPVIASNIDGLNEIIEDNITGKLITPTKEIDKKFVSNKVPLPKSVVSPDTHDLIPPLAIDANILAEMIRNYIEDPKPYMSMARNLKNKVLKEFHISTYAEKVLDVYKGISSD